MPKGPQGQKRPADVIGGAVLVGKIATGEESDSPTITEKRRKAAEVRAQTLAPKKRTEIAKKAAKARWEQEDAG